MPSAPAESSFPAYPAAWYLFGESRTLRDRPASKTMLGRRLVAYRGASGRAIVLDATCSHLGADLGRGRVVGDCLQCPFHQWEYAAHGRCVRIPTQPTIPQFAKQHAYPTVERHGLVFVFNGEEPLFPLPFFLGERSEDFVPGRLIRLVGGCSWYLLTGNGFDTAHFRGVHDRELLVAPKVDCPAEFARRIRLVTRVAGGSRADRFIRGTIGGVVELTITNWGGPFVVVVAQFARATSYMLIMTQPLEPEKTLVEVMVFAPRAENAFVRHVLQPLTLEVRRLLTRAFMNPDFQRLSGIRYNSRTLVHADREMLEFFRWLVALPQSKPDLRRTSEVVAELNQPACAFTEGPVR